MMEITVATEKHEDVNDLWRKFYETGNESLREKLVLQYLPLVKYILGRMSNSLPQHVSREDLQNSGILGLINAVERYDPDRNIKFETYAFPRIKGAIIDELRSCDLMPRRMRSKAKELQRVIDLLESELKRCPTEEEIASKLGLSVEDYRELLRSVSPIRFFSLSDKLKGNGEWGFSREFSATTMEYGNIEISTELKETRNVLIGAIKNLPKKERIVIALYYYEELTMKEIAVVLKVSESRVSQIHTQAILRLRNVVEKNVR